MGSNLDLRTSLHEILKTTFESSNPVESSGIVGKNFPFDLRIEISVEKPVPMVSDVPIVPIVLGRGFFQYGEACCKRFSGSHHGSVHAKGENSFLRHFLDDIARWSGCSAEHGGVDSLRFFADKSHQLELQHTFRFGFEFRVGESVAEPFADDL
jgi:hypothetical protein